MILDFYTQNILVNDVIKNINYYSSRASEGLEFYSKKDYHKAMKILKELKKELKLEFDYYNKPNVKKIITPNNMYRTYYFLIVLTYSNLQKTYSYKYLYDNLYSILYNIKNNDSCLFLKIN